MTDAAASTIAKGSGVSASIKDTIVGIVPSDVVNPFLKANMLQIIFIAAMLTAFAFGSSNSALPTSLDLCENSLGVSKRICAFSMPLGATINMDGSCITQIISALFMAKIFQIPVNSSTLALAVFVLSIGAPGVPEGALVCISLLVPLIGVPAEAISIIMGLYSIVGMMHTCVNVTGDAAVTLITARSEDLVDLKTFNS